MDEHERFVKFYEIIPELFRSYMANLAWTVGLFSVANGWFLSSQSTRDFIRDSVPAYIAVVLVVPAIGLIHTVSCWIYHRRSQMRITQLTSEYKDIYPLPFKDYEISRTILVLNLLMSWSLVIGLIILLIAAHTSPHQ